MSHRGDTSNLPLGDLPVSNRTRSVHRSFLARWQRQPEPKRQVYTATDLQSGDSDDSEDSDYVPSDSDFSVSDNSEDVEITIGNDELDAVQTENLTAWERMDLEELHPLATIREQFPSTRPRIIDDAPKYCKLCWLPVHCIDLCAGRRGKTEGGDAFCGSCGHPIAGANDFTLRPPGFCDCKCRCAELVRQVLDAQDSSDDAEYETLIPWTGAVKLRHLNSEDIPRRQMPFESSDDEWQEPDFCQYGPDHPSDSYASDSDSENSSNSQNEHSETRMPAAESPNQDPSQAERPSEELQNNDPSDADISGEETPDETSSENDRLVLEYRRYRIASRLDRLRKLSFWVPDEPISDEDLPPPQKIAPIRKQVSRFQRLCP